MLFRWAQRFQVIVAASELSDRSGKETDSGRLARYLSTQSDTDFEYHVVDIASGNFAVIIVGMSERASSGLDRELVKINRWFCRSTKRELYLCVGQSCTAFSDIHQSWLSAASLNPRQCRENDRHILYNKSDGRSKENFPYPDAELQKLYDALIEVDLVRADRLTDRLTEIIAQQRDNRILYTSLYYDVLNIYYKAQSKLAVNTEMAILDISLLEIRDSSDAIRMLDGIRKQFKTYIGGNEEAGKEKHIISKVIAFIDENSKSCDLSVSIVADYFNMSISNLSHQFKLQTNQRISDYINDQKFKYAGELLQKSDYRVLEIAEMLGYTQAGSFTRKFKQYYGMTPGEYRSMSGNKDHLTAQSL